MVEESEMLEKRERERGGGLGLSALTVWDKLSSASMVWTLITLIIVYHNEPKHCHRHRYPDISSDTDVSEVIDVHEF